MSPAGVGGEGGRPSPATARPVRRRRRRPLVAAGAVVVAILSLTGCGGFVGSYVNTRQALRDAGFESVSLHYHLAMSGDRVGVNVSVAAPPSQTDVSNVASTVWTHLHQRFQLLTVTVKGTGPGQGQRASGAYTFSQLEARFGARNPSWNQHTLTEAAERVALVVLGTIAVLVVVIAIIAVVVARRRRRLEPAPIGGMRRRPTGVPLWPPPSGPPPGPRWAPPDPGWSQEPPSQSPPPAAPTPLPAAAPAIAPTPPPATMPAPWPDAAPPAAAPPAAPSPPPPTVPTPPPSVTASPPTPSTPAPAPAPDLAPSPPSAPAPSLPPAWPRPAEPTDPGDGGWGRPTQPE